jgi:hypothetical protein
MNPDTELQQAYDEVLKKIGRNLILFQKAEHLLKRLLTLGNLKTTSTQPTTYDEHAFVWNKLTMGTLTKRFVEDHCGEKGPLVDFQPDTKEISIAISFSFKGGAEAREKLFATMVEERNELVHHLFFKVDETSLDSCREIADYLDAQRQKVLPAIKCLQDDCQFVTAGIQETLSLFTTDEGRAMWRLTEIQQCPVIDHLAATAGNYDGAWTSLGTAAKSIPADCVESISEALTRFGFENLIQLLTASEMFELRKNSKGRQYYRLKAFESSSADTLIYATSG